MNIKKGLICVLSMLVLPAVLLWAQEKTVITKAEDLPKHSYQLKNKDAVAVVESRESILQLAAMVKKDLLADLEQYDIRENASLRDYYGSLRTISILEGDYQKALKYIKKQRKLADKEAQKTTIGMGTEALLNASLEHNTMDVDQLSSSITKSLEEHLGAVDFEVIREAVEDEKGYLEIISKNLLVGVLQGRVQEAINNNKGPIPEDLVMDLIGIHYSINYFVPYKEAFYAAYTSLLEKNALNVEKQDIWAERDVVLENKSEYTPVVIAVWDSGVDVPVLPKQNQWMNAREKFDGKDTDGNGYVDDVYGVAFDLKGLRDPYYLEPMAHNMEDKKLYQNHIKGLMDLQANVKSDEGSELRKYMSKIEPEEVEGFIENLNLYGNYSHGTHVAGIAAAGNDMARIMSARITFDYRSIPAPPTQEIVDNIASSYGDMITYMKSKNVRVVNMSWGDSYEGMVYVLEVNGIGENDEERKKIAKAYFTQLHDAFKVALETAPEILFVTAAGNSNDDVDFSADYPSSLNLPNLLTVGAVDIEGKKTGFTTEGESVGVYANGYEVESYVPGGDRLKFSGTSMSSPNVANVAGKMLAVNPKLRPKDLIDIIKRTATKSEEDEKVMLIHPKKAVEMALRHNAD